MEKRDKMTDLDKITVLNDGDKKKYVEILRVTADFGFIFSGSGKAVLAPKPKKLGDQWYPASILRRYADWQSEQYGEAILVPVWFLMANQIEY